MYRYMNRAAFVSATVQSDLHYLTLFSVFKCFTEPQEAQHACFFRYLLVPMFRCLQDTEAVGYKVGGGKVGGAEKVDGLLWNAKKKDVFRPVRRCG